MSIIIAVIVSVCNIFYSIWYLENAEYKDREKKLKIRKNGRIISSLRVLVSSIAKKEKKTVKIEVKEM